MSVHLKRCERKSKLQLKSQHAFPHDFRSGPSLTDWDPTKWIILLLQFFGFATKLRRARDEDIKNALIHMRLKEKGEIMAEEKEELPIWLMSEAENLIAKENRCLILLDGYIVDTASYLTDHVSVKCLVECWTTTHYHTQ